MRAWIVLAALATACAGAEPGLAVEGLWYLDDGRTVTIQAGEIRLDTGELIATFEMPGDNVMRYTLPAGPSAPPESFPLEVQFPTELRMTWTFLDGTPFRELTRVADVE